MSCLAQVVTFINEATLYTKSISRHVSSHPGQLSLAILLWVGAMIIDDSWPLGRKQAHHTMRYPCIRGLTGDGYGNGGQRDLESHMNEEELYRKDFMFSPKNQCHSIRKQDTKIVRNGTIG